MGVLYPILVLFKFFFLPVFIIGFCFYCCFYAGKKKRGGNIYAQIFQRVQQPRAPPEPIPLQVGGYIPPPGAVPMMAIPPQVPQPYPPPCPQPPPPYDTFPNQMPPAPLPGWYPPPGTQPPPPSAPPMGPMGPMAPMPPMGPMGPMAPMPPMGMPHYPGGPMPY